MSAPPRTPAAAGGRLVDRQLARGPRCEFSPLGVLAFLRRSQRVVVRSRLFFEPLQLGLAGGAAQPLLYHRAAGRLLALGPAIDGLQHVGIQADADFVFILSILPIVL